MDRPITLKHAIMLIVGMIVLCGGSFWIAVGAIQDRQAALEQELTKVRGALAQIAECETAKVEAENNRNRIGELETKVTEWETVAEMCAAALQIDPS